MTAGEARNEQQEIQGAFLDRPVFRNCRQQIPTQGKAAYNNNQARPPTVAVDLPYYSYSCPYGTYYGTIWVESYRFKRFAHNCFHNHSGYCPHCCYLQGSSEIGFNEGQKKPSSKKIAKRFMCLQTIAATLACST